MYKVYSLKEVFNYFRLVEELSVPNVQRISQMLALLTQGDFDNI